MSEQVMVIVADPDDAKHGEINVVDDLPNAARLVETMLEAGFDQSRIRVFSGAEMDMRVRRHPVVALVASDEETDKESSAEEPATEHAATSGAKAESRKEEELAAEPYAKNGVRFSTAFRPA